jgi:hypothetical protein
MRSWGHGACARLCARVAVHVSSGPVPSRERGRLCAEDPLRGGVTRVPGLERTAEEGAEPPTSGRAARQLPDRRRVTAERTGAARHTRSAPVSLCVGLELW